ncbi:hypothetical protein B0A49_12243 [Cryomyces minteri]|uniref:Class II aldolase/adducin N-terminal domain-containing protein n=1 Tax=Cryomyces minteri TaxID=331657 RepID=A0A4U0VU54_9PEZI|nr:hypothetical protein B0A49_12243 [Cryomyces minteri]
MVTDDHGAELLLNRDIDFPKSCLILAVTVVISQIMTDSSLHPLLSKLITANHILHYHQVVDAYGHISVRNPSNPSTFFLSGSLAPALVSSPRDLVEYHVEDASPVNDDGRKGYAERFIHSEILKRFPGTNSVVHSHAEPVLPYTVCSVPLRPVFHMGGVMGGSVPVFDIAASYSRNDVQDLLVSNAKLGADFARRFSKTESLTGKLISTTLGAVPVPADAQPEHPTVLMRGHGFTACGVSVEEAVYRAVFTQVNAKVQTAALLLNSAAGPVNAAGVREEIKYLNTKEARDAWASNAKHAERPWKLWCAEVEAAALYTNELRT